MRLALRIAATAISAVGVGLAFPPASVKPLVWVAMAPWLLALRGASVRTALALTWGWTTLAAWVVGSWMPDAVATYFLQSRAVGYAFFFGVSTAMAAVFYFGFALAYRAVAGRADSRLVPWIAGAAWVASEWGRGRLFTAVSFVSNPWGLLGYSQLDHDALVQIASVTGVYGIGFAIAAANAGIAELAASARAASRGGERASRLAIAVSAAVPLAAIAAYGALALRAAPPVGGPLPGATPVTVVQGHVSLGTRWRSEFYGENLEVYLRATHDALAERPGGSVFWPEGALTFFLEDEAAYARAIANVLAAADAELVVGGPRQLGGERYRNSVFVLAPDGRITGRYDKQHLVPFSEYFPFDVDLLRRRFGRVRMFEHGTPVEPPATRAGAAGFLVCNEAMLPEVAAARIAEGAVYLVNPSNDTWIPVRRFADHLFDIVRLRAVETRRYLVRASTSGPSAVVDPWGRVQAASTPFERAVVQGWVLPRDDRTVYARVGDAFAALCTASLALVAWRSRGSRPTTR